MPPYDTTQFNPPAPLARITLRNPDTGAVWPDVPMLLDSGADITMIPRAAVNVLQMAVAPDQRYELIGFDGSTSFASIVRAELFFSGRTFRGQFLLIDQEWGILGRNILNTMLLVFDGPHLVWSEGR